MAIGDGYTIGGQPQQAIQTVAAQDPAQQNSQLLTTAINSVLGTGSGVKLNKPSSMRWELYKSLRPSAAYTAPMAPAPSRFTIRALSDATKITPPSSYESAIQVDAPVTPAAPTAPSYVAPPPPVTYEVPAYKPPSYLTAQQMMSASVGASANPWGFGLGDSLQQLRYEQGLIPQLPQELLDKYTPQADQQRSAIEFNNEMTKQRANGPAPWGRR